MRNVVSRRVVVCRNGGGFLAAYIWSIRSIFQHHAGLSYILKFALHNSTLSHNNVAIRAHFCCCRFVFLNGRNSDSSSPDSAAGGSAHSADESLAAAADNPSRYFHLDPASGIIRTAAPLDRDRICPGAETCNLAVDVAVQPIIHFFIIKVDLLLHGE